MIVVARLSCIGFLIVVAACAHNVPSSDTRADTLDSTLARLTHAVLVNRARLDSAVSELQRVTDDTSPSSAASLRVRQRESALDSAYRASEAELQSAINASTAGVPMMTARFPIEPPPAPFVHAFADGANWMLQSPLIHQIGKKDSHIIIVPRGFVTDFASIPQAVQVFRGVRPNTEPYGVAAVVHDYLYWRQDCTREQSDRIMAIAMRDAGVSMLERTLIYEAVRQFGQSAWDGNRRAREAGLIRTVAPPNDQVPPSGTWDEYRAWLRATRAPAGVEFPVHHAVCAMADSAGGP